MIEHAVMISVLFCYACTGSLLYRLRGTSGSKLLGTLGLVTLVFLCLVSGSLTSWSVIGASLILYIISIRDIFGSIDPYSRKKGAGRIKQGLLNLGYEKLGVFITNFIGLTLSGFLQTISVSAPLVYFGRYGFLLGALLMPMSYSIGRTTERREKIYGLTFGAYVFFVMLCSI